MDLTETKIIAERDNEHDAEVFMTGLDTGSVLLYDMRSTLGSIPPLLKCRPHDDWVTHLHSVPQLDCFISSSMDGTLKLSNIQTGANMRTLKGHEKGVRWFDFSERRKFIASCSSERRM